MTKKVINLNEVSMIHVVHKCGNSAYQLAVGPGSKITTERDLLTKIKGAIAQMKDCPVCKEELKKKSAQQTDALLRDMAKKKL